MGGIRAERCKHDLLCCSECHTAGHDALPQYETGTEAEVLKAMAVNAIEAAQDAAIFCCNKECLEEIDASIRDFKKLGGIKSE